MGEVEDADEINRQWEDAIDVYDSNLFHLLSPPPPPPTQTLNPIGSLPTLRPCSQGPRPSQLLVSDFEGEEESAEAEAVGRKEAVSARRRIPGPAGAIQAAMHRRAANDVRRGGSCLEEQRWGEGSLDVGDEDGDFMLNPWLCAMEFLGTEFCLVSPISSIKSRAGDRVSQVVGIINSCTPNGLGDFLLTLKDPTGCIGATVHHRAILEHNLSGNISVGCVMILKQVVVFHPTRSVQYLNITSSNLVKLIGNDCGPPNKQKLHMFSANSGMFPSQKNSEKIMKTSIGRKAQMFMQNGTGNSIDEEHIKDAAPEWSLIAPHAVGRTSDKPASEDIESGLVDAESSMMNSLVEERNLNSQRMTSRLEMILDRDLPFNTTVSDTLVSKDINHPPRKDMDITLNVSIDRSETNADVNSEEVRRGSEPESVLGSKDHFSWCPADPHVDHNAATTAIHAKPDFRLHGAENVITKVSVAQWTDEQLMELFVDYHEDADLFQSHI